MKKNLIILSTLAISGLTFAQVGVNTETPKATFDIEAVKADPSTAEGLIAPRLTGNQLQAKDAQYLTAQTGAIVYATAAVTVPAGTKTTDVTTAGYYYFNGTKWVKIGDATSTNEPWFGKDNGAFATSNTEDIYQLGKIGLGVNTNNPGVDPVYSTYIPITNPQVIVKGSGGSGIVQYGATTGPYNFGLGSLLINTPTNPLSSTNGIATRIENNPTTPNNSVTSFAGEIVHNSNSVAGNLSGVESTITTAGSGALNSTVNSRNNINVQSTGGSGNVTGLNQNITISPSATGTHGSINGIDQNVRYEAPGNIFGIHGIISNTVASTTGTIDTNFYGGLTGITNTLSIQGATTIAPGTRTAGIRNEVYFGSSSAATGTVTGATNNVYYNSVSGAAAAVGVGTSSTATPFAGASSTFNNAIAYSAGGRGITNAFGYLIGDPSGNSAAPSLTANNTLGGTYGFYVSTNALYKVDGQKTWSFYSKDNQDRVYFAGPTAIGGTVDRATNQLHVTATADPVRFEGVRNFADNAAALAAGLKVGTVYRTGDLLKIVH